MMARRLSESIAEILVFVGRTKGDDLFDERQRAPGSSRRRIAFHARHGLASAEYERIEAMSRR